MNYRKFLLMLVISFIIMYAVMFLNVSSLEHVYLSTTRFYMAILMVSPMALIMLLLMGKMYPNKKLNAVIASVSVVVFITVLVLLRNQTFIGDRQYIKAMIPHHSSAILPSTQADLKDPEVRKLAEEIIKSQQEEIRLMKEILDRKEN